MSWLADTNVLSELVRPRPNNGVVEWARTVGIAATAQIHHLTLVTRNSRDFRGIDIEVLDPFA